MLFKTWPGEVGNSSMFRELGRNMLKQILNYLSYRNEITCLLNLGDEQIFFIHLQNDWVYSSNTFISRGLRNYRVIQGYFD